MLDFVQWLVTTWDLRPRDAGWLIAAWFYYDIRALRKQMVDKLDKDTSATQSVATNLETLRMAVETLRDSVSEEKSLLGRLLDRLRDQ